MNSDVQEHARLKLAVKLLYLSLFLSLLRTFLSNLFDNGMVLQINADALKVVGRYVFSSAIIIYLVTRISAGHNWAKLLYLVLLAIAAVKGTYDLSNNENPDFWNLMDGLLFVLQFYIIYLIFKVRSV